MTEKIYIHMIEGIDVWVPVDAVKQSNNHFLIQPFDDFHPEDTSVIPQFIPGDIVSCNTSTKDNEYFTAQLLIRPSDNKNKKYIQFLYGIITQDKSVTSNATIDFKEEIIRARKEIQSEKFHYPAIVEYITRVKTE